MGRLPTTAAAARSTLAALLDVSGGPFAGSGPIRKAELVIDDGARLPSGTVLLQPGKRAEAWVRLSSPGSDQPGVRTLCIRLPDLYGPGRDQDFLLASSADGVPMHHLTLPAAQPGSRLYSSLWLYLAGTRPVLFGARALNDPPTAFTFLLSDVIGRFRPIGRLNLFDQVVEQADITFAARHSGEGLRPLPPVLFYQGLTTRAGTDDA